ncbi:MAG: Unknown protein [uncultured Thiotrichaceae bacterium]|uniref:Uncharacterized protein n=1 Tax=uncultured Thiotrichaceae bacterium TaxID=298394 RepID=A0A6S6SY78_9GAMM|nr:MAG: Unknown protein [uncultured Thiotrichaceae bacterium]
MMREKMSALGASDAMVSASRLHMTLDKRLRLNGHYDSLTAWRMLSRHVARHPNNLRTHAQRIFLAEDSMLQHCLKGALVDLSLSLNGKGEYFSRQLLEMVKDSLSDEDYRYFKKSFSDDPGERKKYQNWVNGSVMANGADDGQLLVEFTRGEQEAFVSKLEEARSCMEYGQLDEAINILETEMLSTPGDIEIEAELLNLYQYMRDKGRFDNLSNKLTEKGVEFSEAWHATAVEAKEWI